jgi:glutamyl-tRNA synthetase
VGGGEAFWLAVRSNLGTLADAEAWWRVVAGTLEAPPPEGDLPARAAALLPPEPWDASTWGTWTAAVSAATGAKGRDLYRPLRQALTGRDHGPEMRALLPLIGRARAIARLGGGKP